MLDQLKRLAVAAVVAGMLGATALAAPAQAQEPEVLPPEPPPAHCPTSPPIGDDWGFSQSFVPETGGYGQACRDCLAHAASLGGGLEFHCWEVSAFEAQLFFRSPPPPPAAPPPPPASAGRCAAPPAGEGWLPGNVFWHWEGGRACENCLAQVADLEEVRRTLPGWLFEPRLYHCWESLPNTVVLFFRAG